MPELGEVEYFRKQWDPGIGRRVKEVWLRRGSRLFRGKDSDVLADRVSGSVLRESRSHGKQLLFRFCGGGGIPRGESFWMGLHLGMTGSLRHEDRYDGLQDHDQLALGLSRKEALVFSDMRRFGRIRWSQGRGEPDFWTTQAPDLLSVDFRRKDLAEFFQRRKRSSVKGVLLMQERFPGVGNWMADEILWRAGILPARMAGDMDDKELRRLYREIRGVCRDALRVVGTDWGDPPENWLFPHRWKPGRNCPRCEAPLARDTVGGRTSVYCTNCQV